MYYKKVPGERVYLSPMNTEDFQTFTRWYNDRSVTDGMGTSYFQNSELSEKEWLEESLKKGEHFYAIVKEDGDKLIGSLGLTEMVREFRHCTVFILIGDESDRGKGYGTEALKLLLGYAFDVLNMNNVMLSVYAFNERAAAAYVKAGFKEFGRRRRACYINNAYHDIIYMDITRDEWYN